MIINIKSSKINISKLVLMEILGYFGMRRAFSRGGGQFENIRYLLDLQNDDVLQPRIELSLIQCCGVS